MSDKTWLSNHKLVNLHLLIAFLAATIVLLDKVGQDKKQIKINCNNGHSSVQVNAALKGEQLFFSDGELKI